VKIRLGLLLPLKEKSKTKINLVLKKEIFSKLYGFNMRKIRSKIKKLLKPNTFIIHLIQGV